MLLEWDRNVLFLHKSGILGVNSSGSLWWPATGWEKEENVKGKPCTASLKPHQNVLQHTFSGRPLSSAPRIKFPSFTIPSAWLFPKPLLIHAKTTVRRKKAAHTGDLRAYASRLQDVFQSKDAVWLRLWRVKFRRRRRCRGFSSGWSWSRLQLTLGHSKSTSHLPRQF